MDKCRERSPVMVKSIIVIFVLTNVMMCFSAVTNVSSIVGMELTEGLLDEIASRNRTDLDHVVLGSLKAQIRGSLSDAAFYFDDLLLRTVTGADSLAQIPPQMEQKFAAAANEGAITNNVLQSYVVIHTNNMWTAKCRVSCRTFKGGETNEFCYVVLSTNNTWLVTDILIDAQSIAVD